MSYKIIATDYDYYDDFCGFSKTGEEKFESVKVEYITIEIEDEADIDDVSYDYLHWEIENISGKEITLSRIAK